MTCQLATIGSDNRLLPVPRQVVILTGAGLLSVGPLGTDFSKIRIKYRYFHWRKWIWNFVQTFNSQETPIARPSLARWHHQMEAFAALLAICAGNSPVTGEFPAQMPVTQGFYVSFDLWLNEWLSKQSRGWWFEKPSRPLWRHNSVEKLTARYRECTVDLYHPYRVSNSNFKASPWFDLKGSDNN